jgi:5-methylcytosine-specific restriction protein A
MPNRLPSFTPKSQPDATKEYKRTEHYIEGNRFYAGKAWRALREAHLALYPLCHDCQQAGRLTPATAVHHVVERLKDPSRALDSTNLESLCNACHNRKRTQP